VPLPPDERFHELKFLLEPDRAGGVEDWASATCGAASRRSSRTTLLFLDTAGLDVARRVGDLRRERFRIRREGDGETVLLERKTKRGDQARMRSDAIALHDLPRLATSDLDPEWPGRRFHRHVIEHGLRPVCRVTFDRVAFGCLGPDGEMRITFDRGVRGTLEAAWSPRPVVDGSDELVGRVLVEARFHEFVPSPLRALVSRMRLEPASFSKCRRALATAGVLAGVRT